MGCKTGYCVSSQSIKNFSTYKRNFLPGDVGWFSLILHCLSTARGKQALYLNPFSGFSSCMNASISPKRTEFICIYDCISMFTDSQTANSAHISCVLGNCMPGCEVPSEHAQYETDGSTDELPNTQPCSNATQK